MLNTTNTVVSRFSILRERGGEWCKATVELRTRNGVQELSITGAAGYVLTEREARKQAREFWVSYFEDSPEEIKAMNERCGTRFRSANSAARYVLAEDGEFHGLDIEEECDGRVYVGHSWGQIREELSEWFPELDSLFVWHLNGMKSGCVHQHLQGKTYQTHPGHECPSCGTKLGHAWYTWPLPSRVVARVEALRALA